MSAKNSGGGKPPPSTDTIETIGVIETQSLDPQARLMAAKLYVDAQSMPCHPEAWQIFVRALWVARYEGAHGQHHQKLPENLNTIACYIHAFIELITANPWLKDLGLHQPMALLLMSITDVAKGNDPELFKPVVKRPRKNPLPSTAANIITGQAARALDLLIQSDEDASIAAARVARTLQAGRVVGWNKITGDTITNWRNRHKEGEGAKGVTTVSLAHFTAELPSVAGRSPKQQAEWILRNLRSAPAIKATKKSPQMPD